MIVHCPSCGQADQDDRVPAQKITKHPRCGKCKTALEGFSMGVHSNADFEELVSASPLPVIVDFWADWCGPCKMVAPEMEKLAKAREGKVIVAKVDTEELRDIAGRFGIRSIPTMILFSNGRETKRVSGAMPAAQIAGALGL